MKIICKKETDSGKMLCLIEHLLETEYSSYPILEKDLVLELTLKDQNGQSCPDNDTTIVLEEKDLQNISKIFEDHYHTDALTKLYNRTRYEQDIRRLQTQTPDRFTCIYIDVVGLHELNNHLGHAAGDAMLCSVAEHIRQYFTHDHAYRIGGDEFVIFCFHDDEETLRQAVWAMREALRTHDYEISAGMETFRKGLSISETINRAEHDMRHDKTQFYKQNGNQRQLRELNHKLEQILLENQDTSQFLNVIASGYKGVYMVNPDTDTCRYIYIPEYFDKILKRNHGVYSDSIRIYCSMFVSEKDKAHFEKLCNYDYVLEQLRQGSQILFPYEKKDGSTVRLQITIYDQNAPDTNEMLWIFMDEENK